MITVYGVATGTDLQRLREPLLEPLKALADLESFMAKLKLTTLKLTASILRPSSLLYLQGFPIVATSMSTFYAQHPRVADHTIATLFPFLIPQIPFLLAQSNASPFSGAATQRQPNKNKQNKKNNGTKKQQRQQWGPKGATASASQFADASVQHTVTPDPNSDLHSEIYQLRAMLAATAPYGSSSEVLPTPTPVQHWTPAHDLSAFSQTPWPYPGESPTAFNASRPIRPRSHYCWLHGWNTSHNSPQCKKMMASAEYTPRL
jgi:hypothetical protein